MDINVGLKMSMCLNPKHNPPVHTFSFFTHVSVGAVSTEVSPLPVCVSRRVFSLPLAGRRADVRRRRKPAIRFFVFVSGVPG